MNTVKLVGVTDFVGNETGNSLKEYIAYVARVSNPSNQTNHLTADKLVKYLIDHAHWSPFEMVNVVVEINTTRDIARQILRHRSFSFQEFSQRYADPTGDLGFTRRETRLQDHKNRQNSIELDMSDEDYENNYNHLIDQKFQNKQMDLIKDIESLYKWAIDNGIAKEQARVVLPEGLTMSRMYMNGTMRSWYHYCGIRCGNGTQKEHMDVANKVADVIETQYPGFKDMVKEYKL